MTATSKETKWQAQYSPCLLMKKKILNLSDTAVSNVSRNEKYPNVLEELVGEWLGGICLTPLKIKVKERFNLTLYYTMLYSILVR